MALARIPVRWDGWAPLAPGVRHPTQPATLAAGGGLLAAAGLAAAGNLSVTPVLLLR